MGSKRFLQKALVLLALVAALLALVACQDEEQLEEVESTLVAEVQKTMQLESSQVEPEVTAEEPTQEAEVDVEPTPSEATVTAATDMEEFTSVTEFFTVKVPAGWSSEETFPGGAFIMANNEAALEHYNNDSAIDSGDFVLNIGFLPYLLFDQRELKPLDIQFEATPDVFLESLLPMFNVTDNADLSDVELVSINEGRDAGMLVVSDEGREGMILMFEAGDSVVAFVSTVGFPGEVAEFQEIAYAIAAEVTFSGAQEALYGRLLRG
jgi:hypothetical protein